MEIVTKVRGATIGKIYNEKNECLGLFVGNISEIKRDLENHNPGHKLEKLKIYPLRGKWY